MGNCAEICNSQKSNLTLKLDSSDLNAKNKTTILSEQSSFIQSLNNPKLSNRDMIKNNKMINLVTMKKSIMNKSNQRTYTSNKNGKFFIKYINKNDNKEVFEDSEIEKSLDRNNSFVNNLDKNCNININETDINFKKNPFISIMSKESLNEKKSDEENKSPKSQVEVKRNRPIFAKLLKYSKSKENIK